MGPHGINKLLWVLPLFLVSADGASLKKNGTELQNAQCNFTTDGNALGKKAFFQCIDEMQASDIPEWDAKLEEIVEYYERVARNGFHDKCFAKCFMDKLKIVTLDGDFDLKAVEKLYMGGNMTDSFRKELVAQWDVCRKITEREFPGAGDDVKLCKKTARMDYCLLQKGQEMEHPLC